MGRRRPSPDDRQLCLDPLYVEVPPAPRREHGGADVELEVRETLNDVLTAARDAQTGARLDRYAIAAEMSRLTRRDISKHMLDRFAAPSCEDWRFPLSALPALVMATNDYRLLDLLAERCGCRVLRGEEAWIAEFGAAVLHERAAKQHTARLNSKVPADAVERLTRKVLRRFGGEK